MIGMVKRYAAVAGRFALVLLVLAVLTLWWMKERAQERAARLGEQLQQAVAAAQANAAEADKLRRMVQETGQLAARRDQELRELERETDRLRTEVADALESTDDPQVQECRAVRVPESVRRILRRAAQAADRVPDGADRGAGVPDRAD